MVARDEWSREAPCPSNTAAVVVVYRPDADLSARLKLVAGQVASLQIVSNDGAAPALGGVPGLVGLIINPRNLGLGRGLNQGIASALESGAQWCLLLDQDSRLDAAFLDRMSRVYQACPWRSTVGVWVPNYRPPQGRKLAYPQEEGWQEVAAPVTSGSLVPAATFRRVGMMNEAFFIEGIDLEFALRVRRAGGKIVASGEVLMIHGGGASRERRLWNRRVLLAEHPEWRRYLQMRNLCRVLAELGQVDFSWTANTLVSVAKRWILLWLFERQRPGKMRADLLGLWDGLRGDLGRLARRFPHLDLGAGPAFDPAGSRAAPGGPGVAVR